MKVNGKQMQMEQQLKDSQEQVAKGLVVEVPTYRGNFGNGFGAMLNFLTCYRITNDAREDEMEDNMQVVGSVLGNLKSMAADMGGEIDRQNKQLDKIDVKVNLHNADSLLLFNREPCISVLACMYLQASGADVKIGAANKRTEKLLK